jgi:hypothetical protein
MNWKALTAVLLLSSFASAQELPNVPEFKLDPIPPGKDVIQDIRKGQQAPFDGMLFDNATALRFGNYIEQSRLQAELCYKTWAETRKAEQTYWKGVLRAEVESDTEIRADLQQRLAKLEEKNAELEGKLAKGPPWYNTRTFGLVLGVVGTSALVVTGAVIANSVK